MRFRQLDALRFVFALYVVAGHTTNWSGIARNGGLAVDFFFVLSGFVLSRLVIEKNLSISSFSAMRVARLWPLHVATMLAVLLVTHKVRSHEVLANVFLLQNAGWFDHMTINNPAWSISAEMIIGLLVLYSLARFRLLLPAALIVGACAVVLLHMPGRIDHLHSRPFGPISIGLIRCTMGSALGYLVYEAHRALGPTTVGHRWLARLQGSVIAAFLVLLAVPLTNAQLLATIALAALMILLLARDSVVSATLSSPRVAWLGDTSYAIYLTHFPLQILAIQHGLLPPPQVIANAFAGGHGLSVCAPLLSFFVVVIAVATATYYGFERSAKEALMSVRRPMTMGPLPQLRRTRTFERRAA